MKQYHQAPELSKVAGANLKRLLKEFGKTQEDFADEFCVDVRTVRRWVSNGIDKLSLVQQIAEHFNVDVLSILSE